MVHTFIYSFTSFFLKQVESEVNSMSGCLEGKYIGMGGVGSGARLRLIGSQCANRSHGSIVHSIVIYECAVLTYAQYSCTANNILPQQQSIMRYEI